jgi:RHS repeat-associated protein
LQNYLAESDATNAINVVYTNEPQQYGNLVSTRISGTSSYHHFDAVGSTRQLTNGTGHVTDKVIYDTWGSAVSRSGTTGAMLLWIGRLGYYSDPETGLLYVRARVFEPAVGRWTSVDRLEFADGSNMFIYTRNNPVIFVDPSGLAIQVFAYEGFAIPKSQQWLRITFKPIVDELNKPDGTIVWNYFGWFRGLGTVNAIIAAAKTPIAGTDCCYDRIVLTGYSLGGSTVRELMKRLSTEEPDLKIDAVLTVDPVELANAAISHEIDADFGNYCSWKNLWQDQSIIPLWHGCTLKGKGIENVHVVYPTTTEDEKAIAKNAHVQIMTNPKPVSAADAFRAMLKKYLPDANRISWDAECPIDNC